MGIGVGCIGLSLDDFCALDFDEFEAIVNAWGQMNDSQSREAWERARTIATILIQPYVKKGTKLTPKKMFPLPWDKENHQKPENPELTPEERLRRFERLAKATI